MNRVFPLSWLTQAGVFCFFAGGSSIFNSSWHVWQWKEEAMLCEIHMCEIKSHFGQDFLAYCQCAFGDGVYWLLVRQFFNFSAQFKTTKSHQNYVFLDSFSNMAITPPPPPPKKTVLYTGKLYGLTGMALTHTLTLHPLSQPSALLPSAHLMVSGLMGMSMSLDSQVPPPSSQMCPTSFACQTEPAKVRYWSKSYSQTITTRPFGCLCESSAKHMHTHKLERKKTNST